MTTRPRGEVALDDGGLQVSRWPVLRDENGNVRGYVQYLGYDIQRSSGSCCAAARPCWSPSRRPRRASWCASSPRCSGCPTSTTRPTSGRTRQPTGALAPLVSVLRKIESWVLRGASAVLAVSTGVADQLHGLGVDPQKVVVVGNGIDTSTFTPRVRPSQAATPASSTPAPCPSGRAPTSSSGRWPATETHPGARLVFLGQRRPTWRLAEELAPGAVEFKGVVPPAVAAEHLRGATAALVSIKPGLGYGFAKPTKIYAATACGTPVIFAGQGASQELVATERLGWAPGYGDEEVADAMASAAAVGDAERRETAQHVVAWTEANASLSAAGSAAAAAAVTAAGIGWGAGARIGARMGARIGLPAAGRRDGRDGPARGVPVAVGRGLGRLRRLAAHSLDEVGRVADEAVPAEVDDLGPLRLGAHGRAGDAQEEGLLLQAARVGDHAGARHRGPDELGVGSGSPTSMAPCPRSMPWSSARRLRRGWASSRTGASTPASEETIAEAAGSSVFSARCRVAT